MKKWSGVHISKLADTAASDHHTAAPAKFSFWSAEARLRFAILEFFHPSATSAVKAASGEEKWESGVELPHSKSSFGTGLPLTLRPAWCLDPLNGGSELWLRGQEAGCVAERFADCAATQAAESFAELAV